MPEDSPNPEDLKMTMQRAGVVDKPDLYFLEEIERVPV